MVMCEDCQAWFHYHCIGFSVPDESKPYSCKDCTRSIQQRSLNTNRAPPQGPAQSNATPPACNQTTESSVDTSPKSLSVPEVEPPVHGDFLGTLSMSQLGNPSTSSTIPTNSANVPDYVTLCKKLQDQLQESKDHAQFERQFYEEKLIELMSKCETLERTVRRSLNSGAGILTENPKPLVMPTRQPPVPPGNSQGAQQVQGHRSPPFQPKVQFQGSMGQTLTMSSNGQPLGPLTQHPIIQNPLAQGSGRPEPFSQVPYATDVRTQGPPSHHSVSSSSSHASASHQLQTTIGRKWLTPLPSFDGKITEFPYFESIYWQTSEQGNFSDLENVARLRTSLKSPALDYVKHMLMGGQSGKAVMDRLKREYGRPDKLLEVLLDNLYKHPTMSSTMDLRLKDLAQDINYLVASLRSGGMERQLNNPYAVNKVAEKLDHIHYVE